jgi:hypothetical protein
MKESESVALAEHVAQHPPVPPPWVRRSRRLVEVAEPTAAAPFRVPVARDLPLAWLVQSVPTCPCKLLKSIIITQGRLGQARRSRRGRGATSRHVLEALPLLQKNVDRVTRERTLDEANRLHHRSLHTARRAVRPTANAA